jgi:hypothetical protein
VHNRLVGVDFEEDVGEVAHVRVEDVDRLEMIPPLNMHRRPSKTHSGDHNQRHRRVEY